MIGLPQDPFEGQLPSTLLLDALVEADDRERLVMALCALDEADLVLLALAAVYERRRAIADARRRVRRVLDGGPDVAEAILRAAGVPAERPPTWRERVARRLWRPRRRS